MNKIPLLFLSDNPAEPTGLGRITRDLAVHASSLPQFRVGSLGMGGTASRELPFAQYTFPQEHRWGDTIIEDVWNDFAGNVTGVIFTIWDPSRLTWFVNPRMGGPLNNFLNSGKFQRWGYFPVDSHGVNTKLTRQAAETVAGYDRILAYSIYGANVLSKSIGREVDWIPHGYNDKDFMPREKAPGRMTLRVSEGDKLIGMVATNQFRKDWGVAFEAVALLKDRIPSLKFWVHTDVLDRYWNIHRLIDDFGLADVARVTISDGGLSSEQLSYLYSACDATFLVSAEGFGFPLIESMACGIPAIHSRYAGGSELIPDQSWLVSPMSLRLEGAYNLYRPVFSPEHWADRIEHVLKQNEDGSLADYCINSTSHLRWSNLWPSTFKKWFMEGIQ